MYSYMHMFLNPCLYQFHCFYFIFTYSHCRRQREMILVCFWPTPMTEMQHQLTIHHHGYSAFQKSPTVRQGRYFSKTLDSTKVLVFTCSLVCLLFTDVRSSLETTTALTGTNLSQGSAVVSNWMSFSRVFPLSNTSSTQLTLRREECGFSRRPAEGRT